MAENDIAITNNYEDISWKSPFLSCPYHEAYGKEDNRGPVSITDVLKTMRYVVSDTGAGVEGSA